MNLGTFQSALKTFEAQPPNFQINVQREEAFIKLGGFLESMIREGRPHDLAQPSNAVWKSIENRLLRALEEVERVEQDEPVLWQMYNSGVIIKYDGVAIG